MIEFKHNRTGALDREEIHPAHPCPVIPGSSIRDNGAIRRSGFPVVAISVRSV